jgi:hypothetical protein
MGAGVVGVDEVVGAERAEGVGDTEGEDAPGLFAGFEVEGGVFASEEGGLDALGGEGFDEAEDLPLSAAHFLPGIEVEDAHQLMFLALEYFRKV